jgi:hypothetical protein
MKYKTISLPAALLPGIVAAAGFSDRFDHRQDHRH